MKLASYKDGSRDGQLVVVSRDLSTAHYANGIATRLQQVLDDWNFLSPQLEELSVSLNHGRARHAFAFDPALCMAPLPRAFQRLSGSAYPSHVERLCQAAGSPAPEGLRTEPLLAQASSDTMLGPTDAVVVASEKAGIDFGAGLVVVTGDVPMGAAPDRAIDAIRLVMLVNEVNLCHVAAAEQARGAGLLSARPAAACSPLAVTPDELGDAWKGGRVHLPLQATWNGKRFGVCDAGADMKFQFGRLIAHAARTRPLRAGTLVGGGVVSSKDGSRGFACIAEKRAVETIEHGEPRTDFLRHGDTVRIEMKGLDGQSVFGAIDHTITSPAEAEREADA
ncbi:fumarylacetoacetate hydrolase family protein [Rhizobacter sp. LjRoot28]|jgi:fumarylacetoacetate (FAA) hydrolase|uniref:fumarylacetoacetate hydrolase family protein n=1 Tax=Rhizobacter sp. LjRoot28 TaxID=3342309 RepID=UPI003ECEFECC